MAVKETWQGTEVKCLCWHTVLAPQRKSASSASVGASSGLLSTSKTRIFFMILPISFIHIGHFGIYVEKQPNFLPQEQFYASNPCQTWHKQGWNPGPAKVKSNTPMGVRAQIILSAFCTRTNLLMPACLWGCLSKEILLPHGGERERAGRQVKQGQCGEDLKIMLEKDGLSFFWKVCYKHSWQGQRSPRYPHHPQNDIRSCKKQFVHFLQWVFLGEKITLNKLRTSVCSESHACRGGAI